MALGTDFESQCYRSRRGIDPTVGSRLEKASDSQVDRLEVCFGRVSPQLSEYFDKAGVGTVEANLLRGVLQSLEVVRANILDFDAEGWEQEGAV